MLQFCSMSSFMCVMNDSSLYTSLRVNAAVMLALRMLGFARIQMLRHWATKFKGALVSQAYSVPGIFASALAHGCQGYYTGLGYL